MYLQVDFKQPSQRFERVAEVQELPSLPEAAIVEKSAAGTIGEQPAIAKSQNQKAVQELRAQIKADIVELTQPIVKAEAAPSKQEEEGKSVMSIEDTLQSSAAPSAKADPEAEGPPKAQSFNPMERLGKVSEERGAAAGMLKKEISPQSGPASPQLQPPSTDPPIGPEEADKKQLPILKQEAAAAKKLGGPARALSDKTVASSSSSQGNNKRH